MNCRVYLSLRSQHFMSITQTERYDVDELLLLVGADFSINREAKEAKYDTTCNIYDRNLNTWGTEQLQGRSFSSGTVLTSV